MSKPLNQSEQVAIPRGIEPDEWLEAFHERAAIPMILAGIH
jgi:hypothetical protein